MEVTSFYKGFNGRLSATAASINTLTWDLYLLLLNSGSIPGPRRAQKQLSSFTGTDYMCCYCCGFPGLLFSARKSSGGKSWGAFPNLDIPWSLVCPWCRSVNDPVLNGASKDVISLFVPLSLTLISWRPLSCNPLHFPSNWPSILSLAHAHREGVIRTSRVTPPGCVRSIRLETPALRASAHLQTSCRSCSRESLHFSVWWVTCQSGTRIRRRRAECLVKQSVCRWTPGFDGQSSHTDWDTIIMYFM